MWDVGMIGVQLSLRGQEGGWWAAPHRSECGFIAHRRFVISGSEPLQWSQRSQRNKLRGFIDGINAQCGIDADVASAWRKQHCWCHRGYTLVWPRRSFHTNKCPFSFWWLLHPTAEWLWILCTNMSAQWDRHAFRRRLMASKGRGEKMALIFFVHDTVHFTAHYPETGCERIHVNFRRIQI